MKKKGFTLIELLAVIVILAIIALIATPRVMNVIENSKKGAAERSADNYIDAVEVAIASERLKGNILEGEYLIDEDGNLCPEGKTCTDENKVAIEMSGNKPTSGKIVIENEQVTTESTVTVGGYNVSYDSNDKLVATKIESDSGSDTLTLSDVCRYQGEDTSKKYVPGAKYECDPGDGVPRIFYVLSEGEDETINLIMDRNICEDGSAATEANTCLYAWSDYIDDDYGPTTKYGPNVSIAKLDAATSDWVNVHELTVDTFNGYPNETPTPMKQSFTTYARMPYASEISAYNGTNAYLYLNLNFEDYSSVGGPTYGIPGVDHILGIDGYWTLTADGEYSTQCALYNVNSNAALGGKPPIENVGIRPVITVAKDK